MGVLFQQTELKSIGLEVDRRDNSGINTYDYFTGTVENLTASQDFDLRKPSQPTIGRHRDIGESN
jgi:hypothetical protein